MSIGASGASFVARAAGAELYVADAAVFVISGSLTGGGRVAVLTSI